MGREGRSVHVYLWSRSNFAQTGICTRCISEFTYPCTTAAWSPDGKSVVIGSQDKSFACAVWDLEGKLIHNFHSQRDGSRLNDLAISPDGQRLVELNDTHIVVYDFSSFEKIREFNVDKVKRTSLAISRDSQHMLVSMNNNVIQLMEIDSGEVVQTFEGHQQTEFIIRSAFGGADENFVISGSEGMLAFSSSSLADRLTTSRLTDLHMAVERSTCREIGSTPRRLRQLCCLASYRPQSIR
jgi:WD40 repeat protein